MPVKSHPEKPTADASTQGSEKLIKREITMPDGRYMIFYSTPATTDPDTDDPGTTDPATTEKSTEKQR